MPARILIADSAPAASQAALAPFGAAPHGQNYADALDSQAPGQAACTVLAVGDCAALPPGVALADFDGIAWTGSPLSAFEDDAVTRHQVAFARAAFAAGVPGFGSCWGMQVMATALGGQVRRHASGFEFGAARRVTLNPAGRAHPLYAGKPAVFDALCSHQDEVCALPPGAVLLAGNGHSAVQAYAIEGASGCFWGVQYHPEYDLKQMAALFDRAALRMVRDGMVRDEAEARAVAEDYRALQRAPARADIPWRYGLGTDITDPALHRAELANWLRVKVLPFRAARGG